MNVHEMNREIMRRLLARGIDATEDQVNILRRAEKTLHRWCERECGISGTYSSWYLERDEDTGIPYHVTYLHTGKTRRSRANDLEKGALYRVRAVCSAMGANHYYQTDCRGCALYVGSEPLNDQNYSSIGVSCCA